MKSKQKRATNTFMLGIAFCLVLLSLVIVEAQSKKAVHTGIPGFAVLELFTSEGCSSCPPAEALLEKIDRASDSKPIYVLAYHVDYWDRLGWKDAFSQHQFSLRQYDYSRKFSGQVYTPQLVINGTKECVGSDEGFVGDAVSQALTTPAKSQLTARLETEGASKSSIFYEIKGEAAHTKLLVAVVQKYAISHITRGENKGRTLSHVGIVRALKTYSIGTNKKGRLAIELPNNFDQHDFDIISFLQDSETGSIVAASKITKHA